MPKAWDIQPSGPRKAQPKPAPAPSPVAPRAVGSSRPRLSETLPSRAPVRTPARKQAPRRASPAPLTSRVPLGRRRRNRRKRLLLLAGAALLILLALIEIILWQSWLRVQTVQATGASADAVQTFVKHDLEGARFFVLPKNSIFFIPEKDLRAHVLAAFPQLEAVSISPSGLTTLAVSSTERASIVWWCGTAPDSPVQPCYQADAGGLIFAQVTPEESQASSTMLYVYAPLTQALGTTPIGNSILGPARMAPMIQFVKAMRTLGADVVAVAIRGDEADLYTRAKTRITYVLGREQQAAGLATSAFPSLNLNDGSLLYIDLRFDSKVFFKKKEAP